MWTQQGPRGASRGSQGQLQAISLAALTTTVTMLPLFLLAAMAPHIQSEMGFDSSFFGACVAMFFATSATTSSFAGHLADRLGSSTVLRASMVPNVLSLLLLAAASNATAIAVGIGTAGLANGAVQPAANRYLAMTISHQRLALAVAVKQAAIPAASLGSGLTAALVGSEIDWRLTFVAVALPGSVLAFAMRPPPRPSKTPSSPSRRSMRPSPPRYRPSLLWIVTGVFLGSAAATTLSSFFVVSAVAQEVPARQAALLMAAGSAVGICVRLEAGRQTAFRWPPLAMASALCGVGSLGFFLLSVDSPLAVAAASVVAYGSGWGWSGLASYAVIRYFPEMPGRASGVAEIGFSFGACVGPLLFSVCSNHLGFDRAWTIGGATILAASAVFATAARQASQYPVEDRAGTEG